MYARGFFYINHHILVHDNDETAQRYVSQNYRSSASDSRKYVNKHPDTRYA
jgi:hypothetical protein